MPEESLEERIKKLEKQADRFNSYIEIQNLVGKYEVLHTPKTVKTSPEELFALKQPDVSVEIAMWGVFIGAQQIRDMYNKMDEGGAQPGMMFEHHLTTPIIQIAEDGQTAKGLWFSPGHETNFMGGDKLQANWCWGKFGADFIREDGKWKIWHYHWYDTFMVPYEKSWLNTPQPPLDFMQELPHGLAPDKPSTSRSTYFPDKVRGPVPEYPEPYKTWDGKSVA